MWGHFFSRTRGVELRPMICEDEREDRDARGSKSQGRARRAIIADRSYRGMTRLPKEIGR